MPGNLPTGIVMATLLEADPFVRGLGFARVEKSPFNLYSAGGLHLIISGIGKSCAAMASSYLIYRHKKAVLYNLGAAGALREGRRLGEIYQIDRVIEHDRPRIMTKAARVTEPDTMKGYTAATLATSDRPVVTREERISLSSRADLADMEGAAVLQACRLFGARCYLFKIVSDVPGDERDADIIRNIKRVRKSLFDFILSSGIILPEKRSGS